MAADRRARRLSPEAGGGQRTLDAGSPEPPISSDPAQAEPPTSVSPPAALRLEERQARWFQTRERVMKQTTSQPASPDESSPDPKG